MTHETRRAAREAAAARARADHPAPRRRRRAIWITVAVSLVLILGAGVWLGFRALTVKDELEQAQALLGSAGDDLSTADRIAELGTHAEAAAAAAGDPVWRLAEFVPFVGDNLRAVRLASESLDVLANDLAQPVIAAMSQEGDGSPLSRVLPIIQSQAPVVTSLAADVQAVSGSSTLIGPVRSGVDQVDEVLQATAPTIAILPSLLGMDGARNYLLVFQNNAEASSLGGSAASQTLITADQGNISIAAQASSANFTEGVPVDVPVDQSALELYSSYLVDHVNTTTSRPDFPTAAKLLQAFWQRDIRPDQIDGVISVDPIALGRILKATGPIDVGGVELTDKNAVSILLKDVYEWWDPYASKADAAASDAFFAAVASTVFEKVASGNFDLKDMAWAVSEGIDRGDIMMWSEDPAIAAVLDGQRIAGVLPVSNTDASTVGVFFRDTSASKIDYYMDSAVALTATCTDGTTTYTTQTTLHLDLTQQEADALPRYVKSAKAGASQFRTEVFVYGPPGMTLTDASVEGAEASVMRTDVQDLGRPVASFQVLLAPSESGTVTATFTGPSDIADPAVVTTPMVRPTEVQITNSCG
ncbi:DUF4012 domain-containing protein [Microbacterium sp. NPDC076895]|uniref:DUF4012 domain-containing protein n=1 Tax=Microbacterium sp. NPDC076895 TaxID=3154957 RepID=UPI0034361468